MTVPRADDVTWVTSVARRHTPLFLSIAVSGQDRERIEDATGLPMGFPHMRRSGLAFQFAQDELAAGRAVVHDRVVDEGLAFFDWYSDHCRRSGDHLVETARSIGERSRDDGKVSAISAKLEPYLDEAVAHATHLLTMILVQFELEDFLSSFVSERIGSASQASHLAAALKIAVEPTYEVENLLDLLKIGQQIQTTMPDYSEWVHADHAELVVRIAGNHPDVWDSILAFQQRFGWMGKMYYAGEQISAADIVIRLQTVLLGDCAARLAKANADRERQISQREDAIKLLEDDEARLLADVVSRYMHLRSYRLDAFFIAHESVVDVLEAAAHALGIGGVDDILYLDWREITAGLTAADPDRSLRKRAQERRGGYDMLSVDGVTEWIPRPPDSVSHTATDEPPSDGDLIKGVTACAGEFRGRVRIVLTDKDMLEMVPGEVLVTTMTTPSLMLAVEKAGAIVTDEGGMLCHAAIVSREFNIPCVIGTNDATHRLRTGDNVVIDANAGMVRIL